MPKKRKTTQSVNPCIDPESRLVAKFDATSTALFPSADPDRMGMCVTDNCAEDHGM